MPVFDTINSFLSRIRAFAKDAQFSHGGENSSASMFELEQRVLYDASPLGVILQPAGTVTVEPDSEFLVGDETGVAETDLLSFVQPQEDYSSVFSANVFESDSADNVFQDKVRRDDTGSLDNARQLVVIDSSVENYEELIDSLDPSTQVLILDSTSNGIEKISLALQSSSLTFDAVHIVSHGQRGGVQLGGQWLDGESLPQLASQLSQWTHWLSTEADILFYGCNLAGSDAGQELVDSVSALTGADVAASDDLTGHTDLGGNWYFEYTVGLVETDVVFSVEAQQQWLGVLDGTTIIEQTSTASETEIKSDESAGQTFTYTSGNGTYTLEEIGIRLRAESDAPNQTITVSLRDSFNGSVITSATVERSQLTTSFADYTFDVSNVTLNDGQQYVIRVETTGTEKVYVGFSSGSAYADGTRLNKDGVSEAEDLAFRVNRATDIESGLVVHHTFDTDASDSSGNNYDGTLVGDSTIDTTNSTRLLGGGKVSLDGTGDYVDLSSHVANLATLTEGTISTWFRADSLPAESLIFTVADSASNNVTWRMGLEGNELNLHFGDSSNFLDVVTTSANILANTWYHVAVTVDASGNKIYLNGVEQTSLTYINGSATTNLFFDDVNNPDFVGWGVEAGNSSFTHHFDGLIDDGRIYSRALSSEDIAELYSFIDGQTSAVETTGGGLSINEDGGNDTYLEADDGGAILGGLLEFTIEAQVTLGAAPPSFPHIIDYATGSEASEFSLLLSGDTVHVSVAGNSYGFSGTYSELRDGNVHSIGVTRDSGGVLRLYIDGDYKTQLTGVTDALATGGNLIVGQDQDAVASGFSTLQYMEGSLHDIRIFSDVRTDQEIATSYKSNLPYNETGLVANWRFNQLFGNGIVIESVSGNNLTVKHTTESGFTASQESLTFAVDENALDGTVVGSVSGVDAEREAQIASLLSADPDLVYFTETGKFYKVIESPVSWTAAQAGATGISLNGAFGELAVIRSASENAFLTNLLQATGTSAWIGATDQTVEGEFRWQNGTVDADTVWIGDSTGYAPDRVYQNFDVAGGEPSAGAADVDFVRLSPAGTWHDVNSSLTYRYITQWNVDDVLDATHALTYSIESQTVANAFEVDIDTGEIRVADGTLLDADTLATHSVTVRVTDVDSNSYDETFTISLNNLVEENSAPTDLSSGIELNLDGGNDAYLTASDADFLLGPGGLGVGGHTYEVTFSGLTDVDSMATLYAHRNPGASQSYLAIHADGTLDWAGLTSTGQYLELLDGDLHSLAVTWDASSGHIAFYIDGEYVESTSVASQAGSTGGAMFVLGQHVDFATGSFDSSEAFKGVFHDFRVWDHARSEAEIGLNYQQKLVMTPTQANAAGLLANWQFDGFNGSNQVIDIVTAGTGSENNLSIAHATGAGFSNSTPIEDLHVNENAVDGATVGYLFPGVPDGPQDVVTDGLFLEASDPGSLQSYNASATVGDWTVTDGQIVLAGSVWESTPLGGRSIELAGTVNGTISQVIQTVAGRQYQVVFAESGAWTGDPSIHYRVSAGGTAQDFVAEQHSDWSFSNMLWNQRSMTFTADDSSTTLSFAGLESGDTGAVIGDVRVIEIPQAVSTILHDDQTLSYDAATGKFYRYVQSWQTWAGAKSAAAAATLNGVAGDLVRVDSAYENSFVRALVQSDFHSWLNGSDQTTEGDWRWYDQSAQSDAFWSGAETGTAAAGQYTNFGFGEPNNTGDSDFLVIRGETGQWDDVGSGTTATYTIQWDASEVLSNFTFSLTDDAGGRFAIDSNTGEITVADTSLLDYETANSHNVTVQVIDAAGNSYIESVAITIDNGFDAMQTVPAAQVIDEDTTLTFTAGTATEVSVTDTLGTTDSRLRITLSVNDGVLTLSQTAGLTFIEGTNGSDSYVIDGIESDINAALDGMTFTPDQHFNGSVTLNMTTAIAADLDGNYTFEGGNANDQAAGTLQNGTLIGGANTTIDPERGEVLNLDTAGEYVQIAGDFGQPTDVTLAAWVKFTDTPANAGDVISITNAIGLRVDDVTHGLTGYFYNGSTFEFIALNISLADNAWHHIAFSFDDVNQTQSLYLDGQLVATATSVSSINYPGWFPQTTIGAHADPTDRGFDFKGSIDDARIYGRALSAGEIANLAIDQHTISNNMPITINAVNDQPTFNNLDGNPTFVEDSGMPVALDADVSIFDQELSGIDDFGGATLALERNGSANGEDVFSATGNLSFIGTENGNIELSSTVVGTYSNDGGTLILTFAAGTSNAQVNEIMQSIAYENTSDGPPASVQIDWMFNDQNNGSQGSGGVLTANGSTIVDITATNDAPAIAQLTDDAVAAYDFENGTTSIASGGPAITVNSPVTIDASAGYTTGSNGLLFPLADVDSSTNPVSIGTIPGVSSSNEFSFTAQVRFDAGSGNRNWERIFDFGGSDSNNNITLSRYFTTNSLVLQVLDGPNAVSQIIIEDALAGIEGDWHHYGVTISSSGEAKVFIDGQLVGSDTFTGGPDYSTWNENYIGSSNWTADKRFQGAMDDIGVFDRALTASEIASLANTSTPQNFTVLENAVNGTLVGFAHGGDVDGDALTYTIQSQDYPGAFAITSSGELTVADGSLLDHETAVSHDVVVRISDGSLTYDETLTITLTDTAESEHTVPVAQSVPEDGTLTFNTGNGNAVTVTDTLAGNNVMQVTLSANDGLLTLSQTTGLSFADGSNGTSTFTFSGTESDINSALEGMTFTPNADFNGSVTLNVTTSLAAGLVGHYTFEGNANDVAAGIADNGTLINGASIVNDPTRGDVLSLNNANQYVEISGVFSNPADVTLAAWVNVNSGTFADEIISLGDNVALRSVDGANGLTFIIRGTSGWQSVNTNVNISDIGWTHVAATLNDSTGDIAIYINGELITTSTATESIQYTQGANTRIGENGNGLTHPMNGLIDDARVYTRALSADEIASLATDSAEATNNIAITVDAVNDQPQFNNLDGNPTFIEDDPAVILDVDVQVFDADIDRGEDTFENTSLTLVRNSGADSDDQFSASGLLGTLTESGNLVYNSVTIGTVTTNSGGTLVLTFNATADNTAVNNVMQAIAYSNRNDAPPASVQIDWSFNDHNDLSNQGSGGDLIATGSTTVNIIDTPDPASVTVPIAQSVDEDMPLVFSVGGGNAITVDQGSSYDPTVTVRLSVNDGGLTLAGTTGITFLDGTGDGGATISISGTESDINTALDGLQYQGNQDYNGSDTLTITTGSDASVEANLHARYEFLNGSLEDETANNHDGTAGGNPTLTNDPERGDVLTFDGDDQVDVANSVSTLGDEVTIAAWVNLDAGQQDNIFLSIGDEFYVILDNSNPSLSIGLHINGFTTSSLSSTHNIAGEGWNHVAATFNDITKETYLYLNGELVHSSTFSFPDVDWNSPGSPNITIGALSNGSNAFTGSLDDVRVYNSELSRTEIISVMGDNGYDSETVAITVDPMNDAPTITNLAGDSLNYTEGDGAVVIDQSADGLVADVDLNDFDTGTLTVSFEAGSSNFEDVLAIENQGTGSGQIGVSGSNVSYEGTVIGTFTGGASGSDLVIAFNASADTTAASALIRAITYENTNDNDPSNSMRTVRYVLTDGDGGTSGNHDTTINFIVVNDPAVIGTNTGANVNEGGSVVITNAMLNEADPDDSGAEVIYTLRFDTVNGTVFVNGSPLEPNDTFTQADIDAGMVVYQHTGAQKTNETVRLTILDGGEDGTTSSNVDFVISVADVNDNPVAVDDPAGTVVDVATDPSTIGFYRLGESAGATAFDETGTNDGTYNNVTLGATGVTGGDTAADFSGSNSYVNLGNLDVAGSGITMAAWINVDNFGGQDGRIFSKSDGTAAVDHTFMLSTYDQGGNNYVRLRISAGGYTETLIAQDATSMVTGQWYHVAATYDQVTGDMAIYLNGEQVELGRHTVGGAVDQDPSRDVWIGGNPTGGNFLDGRIDEAVLMQRAMTASEIAALAELSAPDYSLTESATINVNAANGLLQNDSDVDGDSLTISEINGIGANVGSQISIGVGGLLTVNADGSFDFDTNGQYESLAGGASVTETFTYTVDDGNGGTDTATATITINGENDMPVADLNGSDGGGIDFSATFTEGDSPVSIVDHDATITDIDSVNFDSLGINLSGFSDGTDELIRINGVQFQSSVSLVQTTTVGSTPFDLDFDGTGFTITRNGGGTIPQADLQALLRLMTYENISQNPSTGNRTFTIVPQDDQSANALPAAVSTITVSAVNDVPEIINLDGDSLAYDEGDGAVVIEQGGNTVVSDVDSNDFGGGNLTVTISAGGDNTEDVLSIRNQGTGAGQVGVSGNNVTFSGTVVGTFAGGSGGMPLTISWNANSTPLAVTHVVQNVTYENTDILTSTGGTRTIDFVVTDGDGGTSLTHSATVNVNSTNDAPTIVNLAGDTLTYNEGDGQQAIEQSGDALVVDVDSLNFDTGTLTVAFIAGSDNAEDVLSITNQGTGSGQIGVSGSSVSYEGTTIGTFTGGSSGVDLIITLNANADATATTALVEAISYENTNTTQPTEGNRAVRFVLTDGDGATSANYDTTVGVTAVNDTPGVVGPISTYSVNEQTNLNIQGTGFSVTDVDAASGTMTATIAVGEGVITVTEGNSGVTISSGDGTGTVTLTGTLPQINNLLTGSGTGTITYYNNSDTPSATTNITVTVNDGGNTGSDPGLTGDGSSEEDSASQTINIAAINDDPTVVNLDGDTLGYTEDDGAVIIEQGGNAVVSDVDSPDFDSGTLTVGFSAGSDPAEDVLAIRNQGAGAGQVGISGSNVTFSGTVIGTFTGGSAGTDLVVTFNSSATSVGVTMVMQNVTYENTNTGNATTGARTVDFAVTDGDGGTSGTHQATVNVSGLNDAPVLTSGPGGGTHNEGTSGTYFNNSLTIIDADNTDFDGGVLATTITGNGETGDGLLVRAGNNVSVSGSSIQYDFGGGPVVVGTFTGGDGTNPLVVTFNSSADATAVQAVAQQVAYRTGIDDPSELQRTIQMNVTDGDGGTSTTATRVMNVNNVNDAPVANVTAFNPTFNENGGPVGLFNSASVDLIEAGDLVSEIILTVDNIVDGPNERIQVDGTHVELTNLNSESTLNNSYDVNVSVSGSTATLTITKTGGFSNTDAQTLLDGLTFSITGDEVASGTRDVTFVSLTDDGGGDDTNNNGTVSTVTVVGTNDDPTNAGSLPSDITVTEDVFSNVDLSLIDISDADHMGSNLTVRLTTSTGGSLTATTAFGITIGTNGSSQITLTGSQADLNTYLNTAGNIQFLHGTTHTFGNDADAVQVEVSDNGNTGPGGGSFIDFGTVNIDITAVNDEEVLAINTGTTIAEASTGNTITTAMLHTTDVDNTDAQLVYTVDAVTSNGTLRLSGTALGLNDTFTQADIDAGNIAYDHDGSQTSADSFDFTVDDGNGTATSATFNFAVTNVNDAPVNVVPGAQVVDEDTSINITGISVADDDDNLSTVQLTVNDGTLNVTLSGSASISAGANDSNDLTLSGPLADINSTLASLSYQGNLNFNGSDTLTVLSTDANGASDSDTVAITVSAVNDTPVVTGPGLALDADEQTNLNIHGTGFSITDVDAASGTMTATFVVGEGDIALLAGDSGVTITANNTSTVSFTGTLAQIDALLTGSSTGTIIYNNGSDTPSASTNITLTINDGGNSGSDPGLTGDGSSEEDSASQTINIEAFNDNPTNAGSLPSDIAVTEDVSSNIDLSSVDLNDIDHGGGLLTIRLTTSTGGNLTAVAAAGITIGTNGTGQVTLLGTLADLDNYFNTASNIQYLHGISNAVGDNADTLQVEVTDNGNTGTGGGGWIDFGTANIDITNVNDVPVITGGPDTSSLTETNSGLTDSDTFTVTDNDVPDNVTAAVDSVAVSGTGAASIPGSLTNATLQSFLTVSPTAILDNTETSDTLTWNFNSGSEAFDFLAAGETLVLTYTVSATDGASTPLSDTETVTVTITGTNDTPTITVVDVAGAVTEDDSTPNLTDSGSVTFAELDETDVLNSVVALTNTTTTGPAIPAGLSTALSSSLSLTQTGANDGTIDWNFSVANNLIQYLADGETVTATYTITLADNSGTGTNTTTQDVTITITGINDAPVITGGPATSMLTETNAGLTDSGNLSVGDIDVSDIVTATVDLLAVGGSGAGSVPASLDNLTLRSFLTVSPAPALDSNSASNTLTWDFSSGSEAFNFLAAGETLVLTYNVTATDDNAVPLGDSETVTITIVGTNDAPIVSSIEGSTIVYNESDPALQITNAISISDFDDANIESAVIHITGNYYNGQDVLAFTNTTNISGLWDASTGVLTLSGTDSLANYEAALRSVTYENTSSNPNHALRTVSFTVNDGDTDSSPLTRDIDVRPINNAPVLSTIESTPVTYIENDPAVRISNTIAVADADDISIESAVVRISANYFNGQDFLAFTNTPNISGFWDASTGTLSLTGTDTLANYEAALRGVTYVNTSEAPNGSIRTVTFVVNDGDANSIQVTRDIDVVPINDAPVMPPAASINVTENTFSVGTYPGTDVDGDQLTYSLSGVDASRFNIDSSTGEVTFRNAPDFENPVDSDTDNIYDLTVIATDNGPGNLMASQSVSIQVTDVNEAPYAEENLLIRVGVGQDVVISPDVLRYVDVEQSATEIQYRVIVDTTAGILTRGGVRLQSGDTFTQADINGGLLVYENVNLLSPTDSLIVDITDGVGGTTLGQTINFDIITNVLVSETGNDDGDDSDDGGNSNDGSDTDVSSSSDDNGDGDNPHPLPQPILRTPAVTSAESFEQFAIRTEVQRDSSSEELLSAEILREITDPDLVDQILIGIAAERAAGPASEGNELSSDNAQSFTRDAFELWKQLEQYSRESDLSLDIRMTVGAITVLGTFGGILWAFRGGALIAVAFSQLPGWNFIDPLPILDGYHQRKKQTVTDEDLASFF